MTTKYSNLEGAAESEEKELTMLAEGLREAARSKQARLSTAIHSALGDQLDKTYCDEVAWAMLKVTPGWDWITDAHR